MASRELLLVDPISPQASYGSVETSSTSCARTPSDVGIPGSSQPDFDKIEVLPDKKDTIPIPPRSIETTTTTTISSPQSIGNDWKCGGCMYLKISIFLLSMSLLIIRLALYDYGDYFFEGVILTVSGMSCTIVTCIFRRGRFAKKWEDLSPKFQSKARGVYPDSKASSPVPARIHRDVRMEPEGAEMQPLRQLTHLADVHRGADVESSVEVSGSSPLSRSDSESEKPFVSQEASGQRKTSQEGKGLTSPTTSSQEDSKTDSQETSSSSPALRAFRNLFKRRK